MKGISTFIATVLTIAFVAGVAVIISGWLTGFTKTQTGTVGQQSQTNTECNYAGIRILDDSVKCTLSTSPDKLNFTIENTGQIDLYNFTVQIYIGGTVYSNTTYNPFTNDNFTSSSPIKSGERKTIVVNMDDLNYTALGNPDWIRIVSARCPSVSDKVTSVSCS